MNVQPQTTSAPPSAAQANPEISQNGLTSAQVQERVNAGQSNTQDYSSSRSTLTIIRTHLFTLFNLVLGACGVVVLLSLIHI